MDFRVLLIANLVIGLIASYHLSMTVLALKEDTEGVTIPLSHRLSDDTLKDHIIDFKIIQHMSIPVVTDKQKQVIYDALDQWQNKTELGDYIKFREIKDPNAFADIIYLIVKHLPDDVVGQTQTSYHFGTENNTIPLAFNSWVKIATTTSKDDNKKLSDKAMVFTTMHETGHALGLDRSQPQGHALVMNTLVMEDVDHISECEADAAITNNIKLFDRFITEYRC